THDLISSDRRYPTVNPYGPLYGSPEYSSDEIPILDPKTHKVTFFRMPVGDPNTPESFGPPFHATAVAKPTQPSAYWGDEKIWSQRANNHNGMVENAGRGGLPRPGAGSRIRPSARRARTIPRPRCSRSSDRGGRCRCSIPRR